MKKHSVHFQQLIIVPLIVFLLCSTGSSLSAPQQNPSPISDDKISQVLSFIDEKLIQEYIQMIVGLGPRKTGTYGCEKAGEYIYQQFQNSGLLARYQNWTAWSYWD